MATILDDTLRLSITALKKLGFLYPYSVRSGTVRWGDLGCSIYVTTNTDSDTPYIELNYSTRGRSMNYRLELVPKPSNLGFGTAWYFRCGVSGKLCRILYSIDGHFVHRAAYAGCVYQCQMENRGYRALARAYNPLFKADATDREMSKRYFKKYYRGKPTRRYRRILAIQRKGWDYDFEALDRRLGGRLLSK